MGTISIVASAAGGDVNAIINNATPGFSPAPPPAGTSNAGIFAPTGATRAYAEYGIAAPSGTNSDVLAEGDFDYATGTLSGTLNTLAFGDGLTDTVIGAIPSPYQSFSGTDLSLTSTALTISNIGLSGSGTGNALNSTLFTLLQGNETLFNNWLFNTSGNNINFTGGNGNDTITASAYGDTLNGNGGADVLNGAGGNDTINGGSGNDTIDGGADNDTINGWSGVDTLTGGTGDDTFVFSLAAHSSVAAFDTITEFVAGEDKIDVSALGLSGGFSASGPAVDSIWYDSSAGKFFADVSGSPAADFAVAVTTLTGTLTAGDFIV